MRSMPQASRRFLTGLAVLLAGGAAIGGFYGDAERGLLVAALAALAWQVRHLLAFERALRDRDFRYLRYGEGIWAALFARYSHLKAQSRRHKRAWRQLMREVRDSANAIPDGGVVLNESLEIVLCNAAARELAGFDPRKDRGQRVDNILRDPAFVRYLKSADYDAGVEIASPGKEGAWLFLRLVPYGGGQKLLLLRDITERKRLATVRREFVANASHELRSPLTVLSGYLDALVGDPAAPAHWRKPLARMHAEAARMTRIVTDLLELSRLEGTAPAAAAQDVDIVGLCEAARAGCASDGGPEVVVRAEADARVRGSHAELETVVANLLSNAIRHTPPAGRVTLRWSVDARGGALAVEDTGEGIAAELIPRLTERFFRADEGRSRDEGGTGLGLAIVKHVVGRHGGQLEIESEPGRGSRLTCRFPAERLVPPAARAAAPG